MSFDSLGLSAELLRAVGEQGYSEPTPIQRKAIPPILQGKDVMGAVDRIRQVRPQKSELP